MAEVERSANEEILSALILRSALVLRWGAWLGARLEAALQESLIPRTARIVETAAAGVATAGAGVNSRTRASAARALGRIEELSAATYTELRKDARSQLAALAESEARFSTALLASALPEGAELSISEVDPGDLGSLFGRSTVALGAAAMAPEEFFGVCRRGFLGRTRSVLDAALSRGAGATEVSSALRAGTGPFAVVTRCARCSVGPTLAAHFAAQAREAAWKANLGLVAGVAVAGTLSSAGSPARVLSGRSFAVGEGPRPPLHYADRSVAHPLLRSWRAMGLTGLDASARASLDGVAPGSVGYEAWLARQPRAVRRLLLGDGLLRKLESGSELSAAELLAALRRPLDLERVDRWSLLVTTARVG